MKHDLHLHRSIEGVLIKPRTVHGMLWLQCHFEDDDWDILAEGEAALSESDARRMAAHADTAGIKILFP